MNKSVYRMSILRNLRRNLLSTIRQLDKKWYCAFGTWIALIVTSTIFQLYFHNTMTEVILMAVTLLGILVTVYGIDLAGRK